MGDWLNRLRFVFTHLSEYSMKFKLLLVLFLSLSTMAKGKTHLVVWTKDGGKVAYALADEPKLTFGLNYMFIDSKNVSISYRVEDMARITYETYSDDNIRNLVDDEATSFIFDGELLIFSLLRAGSIVTIYSLGGELVFSKTIQTAGEYSFPVSHLNAGIYLVTVNGITQRIMKR